MRRLGIAVSVDDFGAGFTSLAYLSSLAVAELKLDRCFITPLADQPQSREIELVRALIDLGHALGLEVIAEGIEDAATLGLLSALGCDLAQGYAIGRPQPSGELGRDFPRGSEAPEVSAGQVVAVAADAGLPA